MQRNGFVLPGLSMGLLYSSIYLGLIIINLRGSASDGRGDFAVLLHFTLIVLVALGLVFAAKKGIGRLRQPTTLLAAFLTLAGCVCIILPFLSGDLAERIFNGHPPILAMGMAFFMPVSLFLFFRTVPTHRVGFYFALIISGSELLWAFLFPLFDGVSPHLSQGKQAFHLFSLCSWMIGSAGLCLGASMNRVARESAAVTPDAAITDAQAEAMRPGKRAALCLIFAAGVGVFCMMGLHMGMLMPKTVVLPELIGIVHFAFLFLLPVAGWMLDENPGRLMCMYIPGLAAVFLLGLLHENGLIGRMPLFYTLSFMQSILLLTAYTATARLLKTHAAFPLAITLAHCLYFVHTGGVALRGLTETVPYGVAAASLALTAGAAFCLWRFRSQLTDTQELWALPRQENPVPVSVPESEPEPDLQKLSAFAAAHALTGRERDILFGLLRGVSREDMERELGLAVRTVRHHLAGLLKKADMPNQKSFVDYYRAWKP